MRWVIRITFEKASSLSPVIFYFALCAGIYVAVELGETTGATVRTSLAATVITLAESLLAVFVIAFILAVLGFIGLKILCKYEYLPDRLITRFALFYSLILFTNMWPISIWINFLSAWEISRVLEMVAVLGLANGLLYFFFQRFISSTHSEFKKDYILSERFKARPQGDGSAMQSRPYIREYLYWFSCLQLSPLLYYTMSFTLFTDVFVKQAFPPGFYLWKFLNFIEFLVGPTTLGLSAEGDMQGRIPQGIIWRIFNSAVQLEFKVVAVQFASMLVFVLPVRWVFDRKRPA
ncbi:MAG: hypothetical protein GKS00_24610 [Alphaproteobacteria bacterium]|nr:hypothetical protein [Alphaproteobacteria bacterium]